MVVRNDYLVIIEEIRNLEKGSLDNYINKKLILLRDENEFFIETLYKDIFYVLNGVDKPGEGDLVIEDGDFKVSGYQTRLHDIIIWLHTQVAEKSMNCDIERIKKLKNFDNFEWYLGLKNFEQNVLGKDNYTIEYRKKLDEIRRSIKKERLENYDKPNPVKKFFIKLLDLDYWNLNIKVPLVGEVKFNGIIDSFRSKNRTGKLIDKPLTQEEKPKIVSRSGGKK